MNRRKLLKSILGLTGVGFVTGIYAWQVEPFWVEFIQQKMPIKNLPDNLVGLTLVQISDIHVGNRFDWHCLIEAFKKAQKINPDFVVYTGDYVSYESEQQFEQLEAVLKHVVKGRLGTIGILGNHDYGKNWAEQNVGTRIAEILKSHEIDLVRNAKIETNGLNFIGFDDYWGPNFNPALVMDHYDKDKANILLCHNPDVCDLDVWNGYEGWILAGHTHGGQCKPPFLPPPMLPVKNKKYSAGKIELSGNRTLYINRALGHLWQIRFNVRPEITIFELQKA